VVVQFDGMTRESADDLLELEEVMSDKINYTSCIVGLTYPLQRSDKHSTGRRKQSRS
jgi:hypothetical protein